MATRDVLVTLAFAISLPVAAGAQARIAPPDGMLAAPGRPGWSADIRTGCWLWNAEPEPNETVSWSGGCDPDGRATGRGVVEWRHDDTVWRYEGEYRAGQMHGEGVESRPNGDTYGGAWRDGRKHGVGVETWANGDRYQGEYHDGKRTGSGRYTWANGNRYEGEYRDDQRNGQGVLTRSNGDRYAGEWRDGKANGQGVLIDQRGRYAGEWHDDKPNGQGAMTWSNGDRYEGEWQDGLPDGLGVAWTGSSRYSGNWVRGCFREGDRRAAVGRPLSECY
jgi:hypothetical protein